MVPWLKIASRVINLVSGRKSRRISKTVLKRYFRTLPKDFKRTESLFFCKLLAYAILFYSYMNVNLEMRGYLLFHLIPMSLTAFHICWSYEN